MDRHRLGGPPPTAVERHMDKKLSISYDKEGDILHIDTVEPYGEQIGDFDDDGNVYMRLNPATGAVENFEILDFSSYFKKLGDRFELPFAAVFSPAETSEPLDLPHAVSQ